jgi:hypothetical protein
MCLPNIIYNNLVKFESISKIYQVLSVTIKCRPLMVSINKKSLVLLMINNIPFISLLNLIYNNLITFLAFPNVTNCYR